MNQQSQMLRLAWMGKLAMLCSPAFPVDAAKVLKTFLPHLEDFHDGMFTDETLRAVACAPRRQSIPAYSEVRDALGVFWRASLPPVLALPAPPEPAPKTPEEIAADHAHVDKLLAEFKADIAKRRGEPSDVPAASPRGTLPDWITGAVPAAVALDRDNNPLIRAARAQQAREQGEGGAECDRQHSLAAE